MKETPTPDSLSAAMRQAIVEARRFMGATSPNPPVGAAALDISGNIIAMAAHGQMGITHAEAALIKICQGSNLLGKVHTICVTLEPCNHSGHTPPCTDTIIKSGIKRVAIGTKDPNPNVKGGGTEYLRNNGIEVITGVEEAACQQLIYAFAHGVKTNTPWITIKRAFDENGSMLPPAGQKTFTSEGSLILAHRLRKRSDAIITGSGTILADAPLFTVRHVPDHKDKKRFLAIMDKSGCELDLYMEKARSNGLIPIIYDDIEKACADLFQRGAYEILVEAGPGLSQSIIDSGLWNMLVKIKKSPSDSPDQIETVFNPQSYLPFDTTDWQLENVLPYECEK